MKDNIFHGFNISVDSKEMAFELIAYEVSKQLKVNKQYLLKVMWERERLADTALIKGIAIPHIIVNRFFNPQLYIFTSDQKLRDWNCLDKSSVNKVICLVVPKKIVPTDEGFNEIRKTIAALADEQIINKIEKARSSKEIIKELKE